jgi:hypothetical protein
MAEYIKIRRGVDSNYDSDKFDLKKAGKDSYEMTTCEPGKHEYNKSSKAREFDREFIKTINSTREQEDQLDINSSSVYRMLKELRSRLGRGENNIRLKVND